MAPIPLEGNQTPVGNNVPQEGNRGGSISLAILIDFIIQRTYHELTVLAELLPRKTDMERKIEIFNFSARTRQLFVRLLALVKWANSASKVDKSAHIMAFLDKQSLLFVDTADMLARMARDTLVNARLPNFHIPAAVEVLTTGTYSRLPLCIRERIVPPDPITNSERRSTLLRLNQVIQHRLVTGNLLPQMRDLKIESGRVTFTVKNEFEVSLTVMGDGPNIPWRLLDIDILVEDKETGGGKALVHPLQVQYIHQVLQTRLVDNAQPLTEVYNCLHYFCQSLQLEVLHSQTEQLRRNRLDDHIHVDDYTPGKCLSISYWRELTSKDPRSELGYRLTVQVDQHDPAKPLTVIHVPSLGSKESEIADRAIRSELLSMERLLVHTIYVRTRNRLSELKQELHTMLKDVDCHLQGSPAILSVPVLQPCLRAEQLLVTVDTHTGMLQCHVPQYDAPLIPELQTALNGEHSRLPTLVSELRYWITQRRCEKTLQHLPATPHERLPLLHHPDHPMSKIGRHRMFVRLHRHPNVILWTCFYGAPQVTSFRVLSVVFCVSLPILRPGGFNMPGSEDNCAKCSRAFFGRQRFIWCSGPCKARFHLDCLKINDAEYEIFMKSGVSTFKCDPCIKKAKASFGDATLTKSISAPALPEWPMKPPQVKKTFEELIKAPSADREAVTIQLLNSLINMVYDLSTQVKDLSSDNAVLKSQISELIAFRSPVCLVSVGTQCSLSSQSSIPSESSPSTSLLSKSPKSPKLTFSQALTSNNKSSGVDSKSVVKSPAGSQSASASADDGFTVVSSRKNKSSNSNVREDPPVQRSRARKLLTGNKIATDLQTVNKVFKKKSLFVTRFSPEVSSLAIQSYLTKELNLDYLVCSKLKTKFNSYSSFHISVKEDDFPMINISDIWPSGCLIAPYYGKLLPEQIVCEESPCVSAPVNAAVASDLGSQEDSTRTPLIVEFKEKDNSPCEIDCFFYLAVVKHSSIEDDPHDDSIETEIPKMYLKVLTLIEFESFVTLHGPFTSVDEQNDKVGTKRKTVGRQEGGSRRTKHPAYFIPELAHVVALTDERLPIIALAQETHIVNKRKLAKREIGHQGVQVEANATALMLRVLDLPPPPGCKSPSPGGNPLCKRLLAVTVRSQGKANKSWMAEFVFHGSPLASTHPKEQGLRRPVYFQYDMGNIDNVSKTVDALLSDWAQVVHLYTLVEGLAEYFRMEKVNLLNIVTIKSYSYSRLVLGYGPEKGATVTVYWNSEDKAFRLIFGATNNCVNAHTLMREQFEAHLNRHRNLALIVSLLHLTYQPLVSISKLPTLPQLGVHNSRPQVPVQTFTIIPQAPNLLRLSYQGMYCLELRMRGGGLVSLRDGAYSRFDRSNVVEEFTPTQGLKARETVASSKGGPAFLSKYVDETAVYRRRSQSEDDNPPSPITMDTEGGGPMSFLGSHRPGPQSPAQQRETGLRFHPPLTPPSGSNPHTPASPHPAISQTSQHQSFGSSPLTSSFSLASPPSLPPNINPSPSMLPHPSPGGLLANSPSNPMHVPSPVGLMPTSSPGPCNVQVGHSPAGSIMTSVHTDGSPFPSQSMTSPAASNWPGSPSMPRPSPARPGQSPGGTGHPSMHSPQTDLKIGSHLSRVLPQRSWAGAVPTLLTHEALDLLCSPSPHPQGLPGPELSPLERFLGCVYMRRQLQRFIQSEECLQVIPSNEPGVVHFKGESLQCRVGLNPQHLQSLHIKVTPFPDHKEQWSPEEVQIIEKFFDTRAAAPPYKPNNLSSFGRMLNVPYNVLKDFVQLMKLELMPSLIQQQQLKWAVQWCLRIPPSATPIAPTGQPAILICRSKILFFLQITRVGLQYPPNMDPPSLVLPLVYDMSTNLTQLAEKRDPQPSATTAASHQLKRFAEMGVNHMECSLFPAVRDLLANLILPNEPPQQQVASSPNPAVMQPSPAMQMHSPMPSGGVGLPQGQPGGPGGTPQQPGAPPQPQYSHLNMGQHPMMGGPQ
uniref:Mediator of RNA polymerase II transcription subunit 14 n=3 Tax=Timema TaxID=61471 RepID=A0A7R9JQW4_TIMGE|nr:unnamed protein product [Timema genevievae]